MRETASLRPAASTSPRPGSPPGPESAPGPEFRRSTDRLGGEFRRRALLALLVASVLAAPRIHADWVTLRGGDVVRGVDLERDGDVFRFTREDGVRVAIPAADLFYHERGPARDLVEHDGRTMPLREKIERLQAARRAELARHVKDVETWARGEAALAAAARTRTVSERTAQDEVGAPGSPSSDSPSPEPQPPEPQPSGVVRIPEEKRAAPANPLAASDARRELLATRLDPASRAALERFRALGEPEQAAALRATLGESDEKLARYLAARELVRHADDASVETLGRRAIADPYRSVRDRSLRSLATIDPDHDGTVDVFAAGLRSERAEFRERAANAIAVLPHRRAVGPLLETAYLAWAGFGRAYTMQVTQRAYVADYELVSGGTGFAIIEVADPVVKTLSTGVALDVHVRRVEAWARLRALRRASGQDFGPDLDAWRAWWRENREP